jgi:pyruvate kinase
MYRMINKTKIVATVGPASWDAAMLARLIKAGVDVFRINFSHGAISDHERTLKTIRRVADDLDAPVAVMADLCGPKIRVGKIRDGAVMLVEGSEVVIKRKPIEGNVNRISTTLPELIDDVRERQTIRLDDGKLELKVVKTNAPREITCRVVTGGMLASGKGVNLPGTNLSLSALTEKDRADAAWIARHDFDFVALSFVQRAADIKALRKLLATSKYPLRIVAKIEKPQAVKNIDAILDVADGIMIARGDLGVEMPLPDVPIVQKQLVAKCAQAGKPCIIATQMLETMTTNPTPTRAEVSDVANAVLDGADAVMLSGETAVGKFPDKAVAMMDQIAARAEAHLGDGVCAAPREGDLLCNVLTQAGRGKAGAVTEDLLAVVRATRTLVAAERVKAVVVFTITGVTARLMSKAQLPVPILALTPDARTRRQMSVLRGVHGEAIEIVEHTRDILAVAEKQIRKLKWARKGDKIIVISGRPIGTPGKVNTMVVHTV